MNNYTTEVAQIKRNSFNFANKISKGSCKPIKKLCQRPCNKLHGLS